MATRVVVRGVVQGVGYRQWLCAEAERLGVRGWVRNRRDGSVEAVLDGSAEAVTSLIDRARQGPRSARVQSVETEACEEGGFSGFQWRGTV